jgi:formyltetrahydrofolate deformylase
VKTASLIVSCKDVKGIIFKVTSFLYKSNANIVNLEQHIEDDHFFMRIEWDLKNFNLDENKFKKEFKNIVDEHGMNYVLDYKDKRKKIALFCSKELHCILDIINRKNIGEFDFDIAFISSNYTNAKDYADKFYIPFYHVEDGKNQEGKLLKIIKNYEIACIGLARYMKVLSKDFLDKCKNLPIINVHHSFLPSFIGAKPYDEAYGKGVKIIGATSHYVTKDLDRGQIIEQETLRITHGNSIDEIKTMGRKCEKEVFAIALKKHLENKIIIYKNRTIVFN